MFLTSVLTNISLSLFFRLLLEISDLTISHKATSQNWLELTAKQTKNVKEAMTAERDASLKLS